MDTDRLVRTLSYVLAGTVLLLAIALSGLLAFVPLGGALPGLVAAPFEAWLPSVTPFVGVPLALAVVLLVRAAVTRSATDGVLAALAVPTLLVALWALYTAVATNPGVYWGGLFSMAAASPVAIFVLADAAIARLAFGGTG